MILPQQWQFFQRNQVGVHVDDQDDDEKLAASYCADTDAEQWARWWCAEQHLNPKSKANKKGVL